MDDSKHVDELLSLLVSQGVPYLISYYKGNQWTDRQRMLLTVFICLFAGILSSLMTHALYYKDVMTLDDWISNALVVFTGATVAYHTYFATTQVNKRLEEKGPFNER